MPVVQYETWLKAKQAASYLGVTTRTLWNWRHANYGPKWERRRGKILYSLAALDAYRQGAAA